jgi:hypothetical protein
VSSPSPDESMYSAIPRQNEGCPRHREPIPG